MVMGSNNAAQIHAEAARDGCFTGHWGLDGTTSGMRYAIAGGYQANAENVAGLNYCIQSHENFRKITDLESTVRKDAKALLDSISHQRTLTSKHYRKVNIGIAWDNYIVWMVHQFEGDYVRFREFKIDGTLLQFSGQTTNGARTDLDEKGLGVDIYYHPLGQLTQGQVARTYCLDLGEMVGVMIPPAPPGYSYGLLMPGFKNYQRCFSPYDEPANVLAPSTYDEAKVLHREQRLRIPLSRLATYSYVIADKWDVKPNSFDVSVDIGKILDKSGAYQLVFWGNVDGETRIIAERWVFHEVDVPSDYR